MAGNLLQNVYLFKSLDPEHIAQIGQLATVDTYGPGEEIFSEGDTARALYVIKYGSVKISTRGKNIEQMIVSTLGTGSHFGEMAFIDGEKRSATATAIERSDILNIKYDRLKELLEANPPIAVRFYRELCLFLCGRLRVTTQDLSFSREKNISHF